MAEGFGPYHVPQQSRRDKLRILTQNQLDPSSVHACSGYLPLYGSSLLPPDLLASAASPPSSSKSNAVKEECPFFTGFPYLDPTPPPGFQFTHASSNNDNSSSPNPFLYPLREFDNYGQGADQAVLFKPQPVTLAYRQDQSRLSLSLSSHHQGGSSSPSDQLNLPRFGSNVYATPAFVSGSGSSSVSNDASRSSVPLGPFTGYASVLKGSKFLKPAQQLLQDFCDVGRVMICPDKLNLGSDASTGLMDSPMENWGDCIADAYLPPESRRKKSTLLSMLDEVYKRYKQYYQQMQAVVASFECVAGLGNAAPFANLALKSITKYFKSLKNAITSQLSEKPHDLINRAKGGGFVRHGSGADQGLPCQRSFHEHQSVWRPQRGLPERAVTVLRAWLFEHFLHPYPTDTDKLMLAKQTGLSRNQVSNWFINARVRLWKPMVEEIHMLETKQAHKSLRNDQNQDFNRSVHPSSSANSLGSENPTTSTQRVQDIPSKRCRSELPDLPESQPQPVNTPPYNGSISLSSPDPQVVSMSRTSTGAVSLTLGLHQNNNRAGGFSEPLGMSAAQRFGLGLEAAGSEDEYGMNGFEPQNRHFGGAQFLHDFVG